MTPREQYTLAYRLIRLLGRNNEWEASIPDAWFRSNVDLLRELATLPTSAIGAAYLSHYPLDQGWFMWENRYRHMYNTKHPHRIPATIGVVVTRPAFTIGEDEQ